MIFSQKKSFSLQLSVNKKGELQSSVVSHQKEETLELSKTSCN